MNVFLCWSGERSKQVALGLRDWLQCVIHAVDPWMSDRDIDTGARWDGEIKARLQESKIGVLCLTPESLSEPWVHFEAGAISNTVDRSRVCPYLLGVRPSDLVGPLALFQASIADEKGTRQLVETINRSLDSRPVPEKTLAAGFEKFWPDLEGVLREVSDRVPTDKERRPRRSTEEMVEEILGLLRSGNRRSGTEFHPFPNIGSFAQFLDAHHALNYEEFGELHQTEQEHLLEEYHRIRKDMAGGRAAR